MTPQDPPWSDEFTLIQKLLKQVPAHGTELIVPPGDDASLLSALSRPVISTDTQRENVHFKRDWQSPREIGQKAVTVTLSDLAASYARPVALFINLSVPKSIPESFLLSLYEGVGQALKTYGGALGGGNVSRAKELSLDLFAIGEGREGLFPKRSCAKPGFGLYVTGPLGTARAGLEALLRNDADFPGLVHRFKFPRARFDAAQVLAEAGVQCVMDISDGLSGDALHMAESSRLTIELTSRELEHSGEMIRFCEKHGLLPDEMALAGGEEYELLFACSPDVFDRIHPMLPEPFRVGTCLPRQKHPVLSPEMGLASYRHGR